MLSLWLRGAIVVLLVLALAGLSLVRPTRELFVVFAVDRSESVGDRGSEAVDAFLAKAAAARRLEPVRRAAVRLRARERPRRRRGGEATREAAATPGRKRSRRRRRPAHRRSRPTPRGSTARGPTWRRRSRWPRRRSRRSTCRGSCCSPTATHDAATRSRRPRRCAARSRSSTVPLPGRTEPEVQLSAVTAPAQVLQGEPFNVEVVID